MENKSLDNRDMYQYLYTIISIIIVYMIKEMTYYGKEISIGDGKVRSFITTNLSNIGVEFTQNALLELPTKQTKYDLCIPEEAFYTPFFFLQVNWYPVIKSFGLYLSLVSYYKYINYSGITTYSNNIFNWYFYDKRLIGLEIIISLSGLKLIRETKSCIGYPDTVRIDYKNNSYSITLVDFTFYRAIALKEQTSTQLITPNVKTGTCSVSYENVIISGYNPDLNQCSSTFIYGPHYNEIDIRERIFNSFAIRGAVARNSGNSAIAFQFSNRGYNLLHGTITFISQEEIRLNLDESEIVHAYNMCTRLIELTREIVNPNINLSEIKSGLCITNTPLTNDSKSNLSSNVSELGGLMYNDDFSFDLPPGTFNLTDNYVFGTYITHDNRFIIRTVDYFTKSGFCTESIKYFSS